MSKREEAGRLLADGRISRREFTKRMSAMGIVTGTMVAVAPASVRAKARKKKLGKKPKKPKKVK